MSRAQLEVTPALIQNPKSILSDRSQSPYIYPTPIARPVDPAGRVTFAKGVITAKRGGSVTPRPGSTTNVYQSPQGYLRDGRPSTTSGLKAKPVNYVNKYNFGLFQTDFKNKIENAKAADRPTDFEREKEVRLNRRPLKSVSVLYPSAEESSKHRTNFDLAASTGELLPRGKSDESIGGVSKATVKSDTKSTSRTKKKMSATTRSYISTIPRRRSGKKLKKRKKSKLSQLDKELESLQPAKLDEEYATELHKITQILKAVSAFDESTSTEQGEVNYLPSSKNNIVTHYTYANTSKGSSVHGSNTATAGHVRRPLSGEELKQLLSSITRVVSLHQLPDTLSSLRNPTNTIPVTVSPGTMGLRSALGSPTTGIIGLRTAPQPHSFQPEIIHSSPPKTPENSNTVAETTPSSKKSKRKKSRKASASRRSSTQPRISGPTLGKARQASALVNNAFKGRSATTYPYKPSRPKSRSKKSSRKRSNDSISSMEKDPVKNALFLRKYFEESIRLANRRSSEELVDNDGNKKDITPKSKPSKKTLFSKRNSMKSIQEKSHD